jgi:hypothetical protein
VADFVPGYEVSSCLGVGAPKTIPTEIVAKLNTEINAGLADPKIKAQLAELGSTPMPFSPPLVLLSQPKPRSGPRW